MRQSKYGYTYEMRTVVLYLRTSKFRTPAGHCLLYYRIRGTSLVRTLYAVPRVPVIKRFHALYVI